jgi:hypothetical protein
MSNLAGASCSAVDYVNVLHFVMSPFLSSVCGAPVVPKIVRGTAHRSSRSLLAANMTTMVVVRVEEGITSIKLE